MPNLADSHMVYRGSQEALEAWSIVDGQRKLVWHHPRHFVETTPQAMRNYLQNTFGFLYVRIDEFPFDSVFLDTENFSDFSYFTRARVFPRIELGPKVTNLNEFFAVSGAVRTIPPMNCSHITSMNNIFDDCDHLTSFEFVGARVGFDFSMTRVGVAAAQKILNSLGTPEGAQTIKAPATARGVDTSGAVAKGWTVVFP